MKVQLNNRALVSRENQVRELRDGQLERMDN